MDILKQKKEEIFTMTGNWEKQARRLREKFPQLTEADVKFEVGKESELLKRLETKLNKKRDEIINIIKKEQPRAM